MAAPSNPGAEELPALIVCLLPPRPRTCRSTRHRRRADRRDGGREEPSSLHDLELRLPALQRQEKSHPPSAQPELCRNIGRHISAYNVLIRAGNPVAALALARVRLADNPAAARARSCRLPQTVVAFNATSSLCFAGGPSQGVSELSYTPRRAVGRNIQLRSRRSNA